jgi:two-component system, NtrC family, nitrogen regulation sensor histidine kinase NtrY
LKRIIRNKYFYLGLSLLLFVFAYFLERPLDMRGEDVTKDFEKTLHRKEALAKKELNDLVSIAEKVDYERLFPAKIAYYNSLFEKEGLIFLIYENDTLNFWTNNSVAVENYMKEVCLDGHIAHLKNGWFEVMKQPSAPSGIRTVVALLLIKKEYPYQNQYLVNEFQQDFKLPHETAVLDAPAPGAISINTSDGKFLCSLLIAGNAETPFLNIAAALLCVLALIFLLIYLRGECDDIAASAGPNLAVLLFAGTIVLLRFLSIKMGFPAPLYDLELFSPQHYGDATSFWLPSLGDFLLNIALLFSVAYYAGSRMAVTEKMRKLKPGARIALAIALLALLFVLSSVINDLFTGLIRNSNLSFNINNLFSLNQYSYIGLSIAGIMLFAFFLLCNKVADTITGLGLPRRQMLLIVVSVAALHVLVNHLAQNVDLVMVLWPLVILAVALKVKQEPRPYPFLVVVFLVFVFSLYSGHVFLKYTRLKEENSRKVYAEKLSAEKDPLAEHLFAEISDKISSDTSLSRYLALPGYNPDEFGKRLVQQYFSGYWEKYDIKVALFDTMCTPVLKVPTPGRDNITFYDELILSQGEETMSDKLFFISNTSGKISYLARLPIYRGGDTLSKCATAYIELDSKFISEEIGFPELLLDREIGINRQLSNYSYAKYRNGELINQFGKYQYSNAANVFGPVKDKYIFRDMEGFNHLIYKANESSTVVLSKKNEGWLGQTTTFSYLFAFFSMLLLVMLMIRQGAAGRLTFSNISFKYRIQLLLVVIVLVSLALFGAGTIFYIKEQYEDKNKENISEKIQSVLIEVEGKLGEEQQLSAGYRDYASYILKKFSNVFFTDINLYDRHGDLLASSRPKLFDAGLTSRKMNPDAFLNVALNGRTEYIHDENVGRLNYLSAYVPFKNKDGKVLAYLNLPYFAKQSELEKEISTFLVALINIYVLLFALSIIIAILISNYVTQPLKLIQDKLGKIKLGKTNELIEWKEKDEIGSLVSEYNRMIVELQKSAQLLAKSERESAWREMAKQVAHEIKNPLTPMKLSIQHLRRTMSDNAPDLDRKVDNLTTMLIEQIDTLSSIANEFSSFAKMPKAISEKLDINHIIQSTIDLFSSSTDVEFSFRCEVGEEPYVFADKDQMLRVFNNLFKNATQAIPEERQGKIDISLTRQGENFLIRVKDNGSGIGEEQIDKIFVPNFTTKTGGMGLGLAMVKNIIENFNGRIWFETAKGIGTTFFISIPAYKD